MSLCYIWVLMCAEYQYSEQFFCAKNEGHQYWVRSKIRHRRCWFDIPLKAYFVCVHEIPDPTNHANSAYI